MKLNHYLPVVAKRDIKDSPLAKIDSSAHRGDKGEIVDEADGYYMVDFGRGAIVCEASELKH